MEMLAKDKNFHWFKSYFVRMVFFNSTFVVVTVKSNIQNTFYNRLPFIVEVGWDC